MFSRSLAAIVAALTLTVAISAPLNLNYVPNGTLWALACGSSLGIYVFYASSGRAAWSRFLFLLGAAVATVPVAGFTRAAQQTNAMDQFGQGMAAVTVGFFSVFVIMILWAGAWALSRRG